MEAGKGGATWKDRRPACASGHVGLHVGLTGNVQDARRSPVLVLLLVLLGGCATDKHQVEKNLMGDRDSQRSQGVVENYLVGFPDVLEFEVAEHSEFSGQARVGPDGRVLLLQRAGDDRMGGGQRLRVEGHSTAEIARLLADLTGIAPDKIKVRVAEYHSQHLYLMGQVVGWQRTASYQGQETVLDVLQRVGGITPGAAPDDVYVVRAHLADSQRPEVFHVDLDDIVLKKKLETNIRVMPNDQIYVGETRQARLIKCFPPWMQPMFLALCGSRPSTPEGKGVPNRIEVPPPPAPVPGDIVRTGLFRPAGLAERIGLRAKAENSLIEVE